MYRICNMKYKDYIKICRSKTFYFFFKGKQLSRKINRGYAQTIHQRKPEGLMYTWEEVKPLWKSAKYTLIYQPTTILDPSGWEKEL